MIIFNITEIDGSTTHTSTSTSFANLNDMSSTPKSGKYLVFFNCDAEGAGNSGGEVKLINGSSDVTNSVRRLYAFGAGILTSARIRGCLSYMGTISMNGTDTLRVQFRSLDGLSFDVRNRKLVLIRII